LLFKVGENEISFDLTNEKKSFRNKLGEEFRDTKIFKLKLFTFKMELINQETPSDFWLCLIKILPNENENL